MPSDYCTTKDALPLLRYDDDPNLPRVYHLPSGRHVP